MSSISRNYCIQIFIKICSGNKKPYDVNKFLDEFVNEINFLHCDGLILGGNQFHIFVKAFICDRPARSFIKCIQNHGGYHACEHCMVKGERAECLTVYIDMECALRTHDTFCRQEDDSHHTDVSQLIKIKNIEMINMFTLNFMHLACLGVMKKLLT